MPSKKVIADLKSRLAQLEDVLRSQNIPQPPPPTRSNAESLSQAHNSQCSPPNEGRTSIKESSIAVDADGSTNASSSPKSIETGQTAADIGSSFGQSTDTANEDNLAKQRPRTAQVLPSAADEASQSHMETLHGQAPRSGIGLDQLNEDPDLDNNNYGNDDDDISSLLAARMGSLRLAEDGQLRYYGPTSNLHVHQDGFQSLSRSTIRHVATEGRVVLERLGLDLQVPLALELHLTKLYFTWADPAIHVVDEETFFLEKEKWISKGESSPYYSETLNNAM